MNETSRPRRGGPARVLTVERTERISPHLVRVHLGGEDFAAFMGEADPARLAKTDKYVKLLFAKPELGLEPPYDLEQLRERLPLEDLPVRRTYTIRSIDTATDTLAIDFVVHGDEGVAGPWAAAATPGERLCFSGPGGMFEPSIDAQVPRLYLGDESALPAIAAALEATPASATGLVLVEVGDAADEIELAHPAGIEVRWLHRTRADGSAAEHGTVLVEAVRALPQPDRHPEVFAHGERGAMQQLRVLLHDTWGIERRALSLSAYWALGRAEDGFQAEKRSAAGQIFAGE
ncbi:siderophore-interacting protein [Leucobacter chromiiresistens]|uniref:NADPH-dependent ferric siderophore reductase, contains FAD-binding and SIP domains n=1 Tax=Leucobacter chromiiresistens TaxID=1079994 RepID=A0A1H0YWQ4_9MICO|nr:siderophore-interacting protein [Leucobacter chromiiresistens]SDQ19554.1 NADPH-dependent ferric siderophore reductase, contains FAD-binding and SIP domains [Leucobacter chromiiresistens]